jgi:DNA uptake protein ComE-like DNA-binding protein
MQVRTTLLALTVALPICFAGNACTNNQSQSPDQIRQQTAAATAQLKDDTRAVAQGIKDGLNRPSADKPVDLNTASKAQLVSLPGMDDASADRVIAGRPYSSEHELLDKHILSREQYNKIADSITVKK